VESHWASERRGLTRFVTEQPPYSIFVRHIELDVLPVTQRYGMGVIVWSPLAGGWLTGKYRRGQDIPAGSRAERYAERFKDSPVARRFDMSRPGNQRKLDVVEELAKVAANAGVSMTELAHAFVLAHPAVTSAIIGPRTMDQLRDALSGADTKLDDQALDAIDELVPPGTVIEEVDRGWTPPWLEPAARRRR
jgi:aryl-alcohol dehydrogenase-like predicted oxidoreductase